MSSRLEPKDPPTPKASSDGSNLIPLTPVQALPTGYDFSHSQINCFVCQDYSIIDKFAQECRLQILWELHYGSDPSMALEGSRDQLGANYVFDAMRLLHDLKLIHQEFEALSAPQSQKKPGVDSGNEQEASYFKLFFVEIQSAYAPIADVVQKLGDKCKPLEDELNPLYKQIPLPQNKINALEQKLTPIKAEYTKAKKAATKLSELRNKQVDTVAKALWEKFRAVSGVRADDNVARARLFFSWLAYSVRYDHDLYNKIVDKMAPVTKIRPTADAVASGQEVCGGYAELFRQMFNATHSKPQDAIYIAPYIGGKVKFRTEKQVPPDMGHAWSAFPTNNSDDPHMKIIDPCWGAGTSPEATAGQTENSNSNSNSKQAAASSAEIWSVFFTMSNEDFRRDHFPKPGQEATQYVTPAITQSAFWDNEAPMVGPPNKTQFIERSSILPSVYTLRDIGKEGKVTFSFKGSCPHVRESNLLPPVFLMISTAENLGDSIFPLVYVPETGRWTVTLDLRGVQAKGYYFISIRAAFKKGVPLDLQAVQRDFDERKARREAAAKSADQGKQKVPEEKAAGAEEIEYAPLIWWKFGDVPSNALTQWYARWQREKYPLNLTQNPN